MRLLRNALCIFALFYLFTPTSYSNKDLKPYRDEVMDIIDQHCNSADYYHPRKQFLYFQKLTDYKIGECFINPLFYTIKIDLIFWAHANETERFELLSHELTHCALVYNHVDNYYNYMYYSIVTLSKDVILNQFLDNIKRRCGR